jgi:molybdopterin/thiamine biosynthesis adenylyltransferase
MGQQLAHVGVGRYTIIDSDRIDESNLNRLIGGASADVARQIFKTAIAARQIKRILPLAKVKQIRKSWQEVSSSLVDCDVIVACLDTYAARLELEAFSRRHFILLVDLGIDVFEDREHFAISGQVTQSMPDSPCLKCMGVIQEEWRSREAQITVQVADAPRLCVAKRNTRINCGRHHCAISHTMEQHSSTVVVRI